MKKGISVLGICLLMLVLLGAFHETFADSINLTLDTTSTSRIAFDSGTAFTYATHGNLLYNGESVGVFNSEYTAQSLNGYLTKYDLVITGEGTIPEFASILLSNKPIAPAIVLNPDAIFDLVVVLRPTTIAKGTIVATSPNLKAVLGATVELMQPVLAIEKDYLRITY